ncbi:glycosyltransferase [bacterium]|nr:MAG: glycosyltransferase [bacterium]
MTKSTIDLSLIIPAYMEGKIIKQSLNTLADYLDAQHLGQVEIIVVTADSPDGTTEQAQSVAGRFKHFRVHQLGARVGKGRDVRAGMLEAKGRYRLFMDADLATPLEHIAQSYELLKNGAPIVIAVRDLFSIHKGIFRKFMSSFGNLFIQALILPGIKDTQCGFKGFSAVAAEEIFPLQTMMGWSFDAEILKIARIHGYRITTINANDWHDPKTGDMGLVGDSPLKAAIKTFSDTIVIAINAVKGVYR